MNPSMNDRLKKEFLRLQKVEQTYLTEQFLQPRQPKVLEADQHDEVFMNEFRRLQDIEQHYLNLRMRY